MRARIVEFDEKVTFADAEERVDLIDQLVSLSLAVDRVNVFVSGIGGSSLPTSKPRQQIRGPDNPTCQLLPTSSQRKVKMGWEGQERDKRWWRIGVCKKCISK